VATPVVGAAEATRAVLAHRRHRRAATDRRTLALGVVALLTSGAVAAGEVIRVWRRGSAPLPAETADVLGAAEEAARQTVEVAVSGYRAGSRRETALLGMLASFTVSFGAVRATTHLIRSRGRWGPMHNLRLGRRHIHHFVPGIVLAFLAGGASIISRDEGLDPWLAVPFGTGLALTLDESALLLEFDDVYWTEQGVSACRSRSPHWASCRRWCSCCGPCAAAKDGCCPAAARPWIRPRPRPRIRPRARRRRALRPRGRRRPARDRRRWTRPACGGRRRSR
jgi:hypothetical protein